ncbi:hypothetical protein [Roseomonas harenae]|uniref:hypothetical protein n=1 Tax=Muricoccus harenae TaxID=2692566 RepID=UPI001331234B|nr:hypothetical protein [Roseomonas harenae]
MPEPRTFRDLVLSLPQIVSHVADSVTTFAFGRTIRPVPLAELPRASRPDFFRDAESRIGDALNRMETMPADELGLLVTDLFLTGDEIFGGASAIRAPLGRILSDGRSVGLMGIRSGFSGTIFDIPGVRTYDGASERPFYVVATGSLPAVTRLLHRIEVEILASLPPTPDGAPRSQVTIFSRRPLEEAPIAVDLTPVAPALTASSLAPALGPDVRQIAFPNAGGLASARIPLQERAAAPILLPDIFQVEEAVWAESAPRAACADRWLRIRSLPGPLASVSLRDGAPVLTVGGSALSRVPPGVPFLVQARVTASGLSEAPAATAWTRAWNLEARDAEAFTATRPSLFRTLHLREVATMLETLVREELQPQPIAEALLAFQIPRR